MTARINTPPNVPTRFAAVATSIVAIAVVIADAEIALGQNIDNEEAITPIVVTGSRIVRRDFSSPSPIATLSRDALEGAGQPTLEETLNRMPQITPDFERTANNPGDGRARVNLRGLGSNRTLVMLNGRRLAPSGVDTSVDVNNLPQSLVDRVEIITGGATTVYGSDAVSGVVNFITRDDFDGFSMDVTAYTTEAGDANIHDFNLSFGHNFAGGNGNITLYGGFYDRSELFASARAFTVVPIEDVGGMLREGGSLSTPSSVVTFPPVNFGNGPARTTFDADGLPIEFMDPADRYNFAPRNYLQSPLLRTSAGLLFHHSIGDRSEIYTELGYTRNRSKQNLAPIPVNNLLFTNLNNPVLAPATQQFFTDNFAPPFFPPGTAGFFLARRLEELGPRIFDRKRDYSRIVTGFRGELRSGWDFDVWLTYTENDEDTLLRNGASAASFQQGLFVDPVSGQCFDPSGGCVPLNVWGAGNLSAAGAEFIRLPDLLNTTSRQQKLISGFIRGTPFDTWAGAVDLALGAEWRSDDGSFLADSALFSGDALGYRGAAGVNGRESVYEIYGEAVIPLVANRPFAEHVSLELGARYSEYDKAGSAETYKIGGEWQLVPALELRAMVQRSVRAPNIAEAFQEQFLETGAFVGAVSTEDPCSASSDPVGNGNVDACIATGLPASEIGLFEASVGVPTDFIRGGNPNLVPEKADTFTVGAVLTLGESQNWQLSVDYFDLEIENTIGDLVATVACFDPANVQNLFCGTFTRDPVSYNVMELRETKVNRGGQHATGIDTQIAFSSVLPDSAAITGGDAVINANIIWTHTRRNDITEIPAGTALRCAGRFGFPCNAAADGNTYPGDRIAANVSYHSGDLGVFLNWRWIGGTDNGGFLVSDFFGTTAPDLVIADIGSRHYVDLGVGYQFSDHIGARLNVSNLLDKDPPLMADAVVSNNTDTGIYDIFGRSYALTLSLRF